MGENLGSWLAGMVACASLLGIVYLAAREADRRNDEDGES